MVDARDYAQKKMNQFSNTEEQNSCIDEKLLIYRLINVDDEKIWNRLQECQITEDTFEDIRNKYIFHEVKSMHDEGILIDIRSVICRLDKIAYFKNNGGSTAYLKSLNNDHMRIYNETGVWGDTIFKNIQKRYFARIISELGDYLKNNSDKKESDDLVIYGYNVFNKISDIKNKQKSQDITSTDLYVRTGEEIREKQKNPDKKKEDIIPTGYKAIDDDYLSGGLYKGELCIIGARPGVGKTALALSIAENVMLNDDIKAPILFYSLEMRKHEIGKRLVSSLASIDGGAIRKAELTGEDWDMLTNTFTTKILPHDKNNRYIHIRDVPDMTPSDIKNHASEFQKEHGLSLIVIDYLGFMELPGNNSRYDQITKMVHQVKMIALTLNVPIILLAQLNREIASRKNSRPMLSDLKESGRIEEEANIVIFIHREDDDNFRREIVVAKNREGCLGSFFLTFNGQYSRFED